jgi:hypothetical protein
LESLDRSFTYFIVARLGLGIGSFHFLYPVLVPCDLKLIGFMAGGCAAACKHYGAPCGSCKSYVKVVPIPLLSSDKWAGQDFMSPKKHNLVFQGKITHKIRAS